MKGQSWAALIFMAFFFFNIAVLGRMVIEDRVLGMLLFSLFAAFSLVVGSSALAQMIAGELAP